MAIPSTAVVLPKTLDPSDIKDVKLNIAPALEAGEGIASYDLVLSAEAIAAGMEILSGGGRDPVLTANDTQIIIWPAIDPGEALNPIFADAGVRLAVEATIVTNSFPTRTDQQTFVITWAQK